MSKKRIAVIPGDGIGKEVMPEGVRVVDAAARKFGIDLQFDHFDFSSWDYCEKHGQYMPDNWKDQVAGQRLAQPLRVLWGEHGAVGRCFDVPALWAAFASQFSGRSLPCGHYIAEEAPALLLDETLSFFRSKP